MMRFDISELAGPNDWSGPTMPPIGTARAKLRWIKSPYHWHRNTGAELFMVLEGEVDMHVRLHPTADEQIVTLGAGQSVMIEAGEEHVAHPRGEAKILVVEEEGSE